jgi:predicted PurR-regulated permease PerM
VVLGTSITALVQGTLLGIGFAIVGLPSPLVFGVLGAVASLIPFVGTALVGVPAVLTLFAQGQTGWGIFLLLWCIVLVGGSDNVVRPLIISGNSGASTLLVFVGILGGVGVFGFAGIFMGPLVLTLAQTLLEYAGQELPRPSAPLPSPGALMPPPVAIAENAPTQPPAPASEQVTEPPPPAKQ